MYKYVYNFVIVVCGQLYLLCAVIINVRICFIRRHTVAIFYIILSRYLTDLRIEIFETKSLFTYFFKKVSFSVDVFLKLILFHVCEIS